MNKWIAYKIFFKFGAGSMRNCKMCGVSKKDSSIGESERMQSKHRSCFTSMREIASEEMAGLLKTSQNVPLTSTH